MEYPAFIQWHRNLLISDEDVLVIIFMMLLWLYSIYLTARAYNKLLSDGRTESDIQIVDWWRWFLCIDDIEYEYWTDYSCRNKLIFNFEFWYKASINFILIQVNTWIYFNSEWSKYKWFSCEPSLLGIIKN